MKPFRLLKANEIDVRLQQFKKTDRNGKQLDYPFAQYLLYKDARCDMALMSEVYGDLWKREHEFKDGKLYCKVSVWNKEINQWISREDVGTESNTEAEKGQSSDSFKRACTNFGSGRELYSSPQIKVYLKDHPSVNEYTKILVSEIEYDENEEISKLSLCTEKGEEVYTWSSKTQNKAKNKPSVKNTPKVEKTEQVEEKVEEEIQWSTKEQIIEICKMPQEFITWAVNALKTKDPRVNQPSDMTFIQAEWVIKKWKQLNKGDNGNE